MILIIPKKAQRLKGLLVLKGAWKATCYWLVDYL